MPKWKWNPTSITGQLNKARFHTIGSVGVIRTAQLTNAQQAATRTPTTAQIATRRFMLPPHWAIWYASSCPLRRRAPSDRIASVKRSCRRLTGTAALSRYYLRYGDFRELIHRTLARFCVAATIADAEGRCSHRPDPACGALSIRHYGFHNPFGGSTGFDTPPYMMRTSAPASDMANSEKPASVAGSYNVDGVDDTGLRPGGYPCAGCLGDRAALAGHRRNSCCTEFRCC